MSAIKYEIATIKKMIHIYCQNNHRSNNGELCVDCDELYLYAQARLMKCPYGDKKGACANCKIHCYNKQMKQQMKLVMRFSWSRMIIYHPKDLLRHIFIDRKWNKKIAPKK